MERSSDLRELYHLTHLYLDALKASPPTATLDAQEAALSRRERELHADMQAAFREHLLILCALATWTQPEIAKCAVARAGRRTRSRGALATPPDATDRARDPHLRARRAPQVRRGLPRGRRVRQARQFSQPHARPLARAQVSGRGAASPMRRRRGSRRSHTPRASLTPPARPPVRTRPRRAVSASRSSTRRSSSRFARALSP